MNRPVVIHVFDGLFERIFVNDEEIAYDDAIHVGDLLAELGKRLGFNVISQEVDDVRYFDASDVINGGLSTVTSTSP